MEREVAAYAPASVSNVACGFDIMGFAPSDHPGDNPQHHRMYFFTSDGRGQETEPECFGI